MRYPQLKSAVLEDLKDYMSGVLDDGGDPGYTMSDIQTCEHILDGFYSQVQDLPHGAHEQVLAVVIQTVHQLNALSDRCEGMIETEQRELLCDLLNKVANEKGVGSDSEDLTEDHRDW